MDAIKTWWQEASSKDQLYVVVCGVCVVLYILYMGVYKPVKSMRDDQLKQNTAQLASLERVKEMAAQLEAQKKGGNTSSSSPIDNIVQISMSQNGLRASGVDSSGKNGVRVRIDAAKFENALAWLYELEVNQGLRIKDLSIASGADPGTVSINLRIEQG